ncbi:MAG: NapC/NirT family cytochrome c [Desulfobulbaceae bacterium]
MAQVSKTFVTGLINFFTRSRCSLLGGVIVGVLLPVLAVSILLDMQGVVENPYFGFLIYLVMGPLFALGLLLIIGGTLFCGKKEDIGRLTVEYIKEEMARPGHFTRIRKLIFITSLLTFLTLMIVGVVTYTGFHYTESVGFCAQFCHSVMEPEYVTYKNSPHSQVPCVKCHIGTGSEWFTKAKFSGARQLFAVLFDTYERPIPTPIDALRPERTTCEGCHRPEVFHGDKLYVKDTFLPDEENTHLQTVLVMRIGSGDYSGRKAHGIHWHISENHRVSYFASKDRRYISQVTLEDPGQQPVVFRRQGESLEPVEQEERLMDCMDCHNRPTHVFLEAGPALDAKLVTGTIPREIPFIKRQALAAITKEYPSQDVATRSIAKELMDWYREQYPELVAGQEELLKKAVLGVQQAYLENIFPEMRIGWQTYQSFTCHQAQESGCYRCHNDSLRSESGKSITQDCNACHIVLMENAPARDMEEILQSAAIPAQ